jgi:protein O-GlcNAc transferase
MSHKSIADLFNRARASRERGDYAGAMALLRTILDREPANAQALNNLGLLYHEKGDVEQAEAVFRQALNAKPDLFEAHAGLGAVREQQGDLSGAKDCYCEALRLRPDAADIHFRLGVIMREWDRLDRAAACFRNALRFNPGHVMSLVNLGEALQAGGQIGESEDVLQKAMALDPASSSAHSNLLISMNYDPACSPQEVFDAHCRWGRALAGRVQRPAPFANIAHPERRLKIGYVSADFCKHPAASFIEPVLEHRDPSSFELFCYSQGKVKDEKTENLKRYADKWQDIRDSDDDNVDAGIRRDAIDILVDCTGHMADNRLPLFARKCAPVQVSWIGYPNTTGLPTVDYRFTDAVLDPPEETALFTETLVRLERGFCCYKPPDNAAPVSLPPAKANGFVTFGSLHNPARLNKEVIGLWSAVLRAIPASRLVIFRTTLDHEIIGRLSEGFTAEGIDVRRIDFLRDVPAAGHLAVYHQVDIALDTFPWSGHTTACEALWMGVPVVTLRGNRHAGRMVASVLAGIGLANCIAENKAEFVSIVQKMATDIASLSQVRTGLRERMKSSQLCDGMTFTREVEKKYREIWRKWCREKT